MLQRIYHNRKDFVSSVAQKNGKKKEKGFKQASCGVSISNWPANVERWQG
jgi:hypothetical protein